MESLSPVISGNFSVSDLMREAAARSIEVSAITDADTQISTPSMSGMIMAEEVQPGLLMSGFDLNYIAEHHLDVEMERSIMCGLLLDGVGEALEIRDAAPVSQETGRLTIVGFGEPRICARPWFKGQRARVFGVTLKPHFFNRFGETMGHDGLGILRSYLDPGVHCATLPWSRKLIDLAEGVLNEPYGGSLRTLFRESQTLQFTLEMASQLEEKERLVRVIGRRQYERAYEAREILDQTLANPPKMLDLARQLGVNVTTLQSSFKAVFGATLFGYVRNQRLAMARILMLEHSLGVAEAGYRVGFTNAAAFTAAYRRHFGCPPTAERGRSGRR